MAQRQAIGDVMARVVARTMAIGAVLLLAIVLMVGCSAEGGVVDNDGLRDLQADGVRVVDVRTAAEYAAGYIPGAENVDMMSLSQAAAAWDPTEPIVLYCATGSRSAEAAQILRSMGFERVYDLSAGIIAWDGDIETPQAAGSGEGATPPAGQASEIPVMYEFYTDW
jgi:rhodanese-related sulfurtransferase